MKPNRGRIAFTPSAPLRELLDRLHALTGKPRTGIIAEMLDTVAPVFGEQVTLMQKLASAPDRAADLVREFGLQGINTISQQLLDLPPPKKRGRPRKHATP